MKLAAIWIVKNDKAEIKHLFTSLDSVAPHVDGIFINLNGRTLPTVSKKLKDKLASFGKEYGIITTLWEENFSKARLENFAQVPDEYEWVVWLDTDDTVDHPEKLREIAEKSTGIDCIHANYEYDHDELGNTTLLHIVPRLFKNNGSMGWKPTVRIHEILTAKRGVVQAMTKDFTVIHHADEQRTIASFERNIALLEKQIEDEASSPDPRTIMYLASAYMDAKHFKDAISLFEQYLKLSGWDEERSLAYLKLGRIYTELGNTVEAQHNFAKSIAEYPANPEPYVELASIDIENEQYQKAVVRLKQVLTMKGQQTTLEFNPLTQTYRTYLLLAEAYLNIGGKDIDKAELYAQMALNIRADDKTKHYVETTKNLLRDRKILISTVEEYKKLYDEGKKDDAKSLLTQLPDNLKDNPVISRLLRRDETFTWPKKSIVIVTGDTALDFWGPWSLSDGIGGSEEAIIRLAPKLAQKGYKVVVFAKPGDRAGLIDGVMWRNFWDFNPDDTFDIFIAWRSPYLFDKKIQARKSYLWLHDVMEPEEFTETRIQNFDKCIVLSKYHRSLFPMIPDEKIMLSGNGIDSDEFVSDVQRDPHKIFYGSSHVRGLAYLYDIWPKVKAAVPDATLDVFYGRYSYDKINAGNPERLKWMDDMIAKAKELDGVTDYGKIGQDELVKRMFASGIWAYPTSFAEIYCITSIKTQASGCIPVVSDFAALDEMVQFGEKLHHDGEVTEEFLDRYTERLIWWLQHPEEQEKIRPAMMEWARTKSWQAICDQWIGEFA